jgi:hypothetical protein
VEDKGNGVWTPSKNLMSDDHHVPYPNIYNCTVTGGVNYHVLYCVSACRHSKAFSNLWLVLHQFMITNLCTVKFNMQFILSRGTTVKGPSENYWCGYCYM